MDKTDFIVKELKESAAKLGDPRLIAHWKRQEVADAVGIPIVACDWLTPFVAYLVDWDVIENSVKIKLGATGGEYEHTSTIPIVMEVEVVDAQPA